MMIFNAIFEMFSVPCGKSLFLSSKDILPEHEQIENDEDNYQDS